MQVNFKTFFAAQEIRVSLYHEFERYLPLDMTHLIASAFKQHLAGEKSDSEIATVIASTTSSFNELSRRIIRCEEILKDDLTRPDLAGMIRRIQNLEKGKFEAVPLSSVLF